MRKPHGCLLIALVLSSFVSGCVIGGAAGSLSHRTPGYPVYAKLPHHVPPSPDSPAFRFAMVHDVIHERYARHGNAFYEERERLARERMAGFHPDSETAFALTDDIAVGLDRRGKSAEAIELMRDKLKRQEKLNLTEKEKYSTYANLAEFLLHLDMWGMMEGELTARERIIEARGLIKKSMDANPKAHFGREAWQGVAIDAMLDFRRWPVELRKTDLIGNRLDGTIEVPDQNRRRSLDFDDAQRTFARPYTFRWSYEVNHETPPRSDGISASVPSESDRANWRRERIALVGNESPEANSPSNQGVKRAPFDEPALWLIGEWRQGSGPNPHYALCLGEIMLRVGQRYLAWNCFERAVRMAEQFWPTQEMQEFLRKHCGERQQAIEKSLPQSEVATFRANFEKELAFGSKYQHDYQAFTEQQIQAGKNLNDPQFFDEFHNGRPPIVSKVGPEEWYAGEKARYGIDNHAGRFWTWGLFTGGACLLLTSLVASWMLRSKAGSMPNRASSLPKSDQLPQGFDPLGSKPQDSP